MSNKISKSLIKGFFLGATSVLGGGSAAAAEVQPGGALDVTISGFARFLAAYGDLDQKAIQRLNEENEIGGGLDFRNDTEIHFLVRGRHDATGIEYGGTVEFEADTNRTGNTDETWIFTRGGWGEFRFGDTDSAANTMKIGGYTVAVGTGGIDGTIVEVNPLVLVDFDSESEDFTKLIYYSPTIEGFQLGLSYQPDNNDASVGINGGNGDTGGGDSIAVRDPRNPLGGRGTRNIDDIVSAGLSYTGLLGPVGLTTSAVGTIDPHDADDTWITYAGAALTIGDLSIAGGGGWRRFDTNNNSDNNAVLRPPITCTLEPKECRRQNDQTREFFNLGIAYNFGRVAASLTYGLSTSEFGDRSEFQDQDLVLGVEIGLLPGLTISNEIAYFRLEEGNSNETATPPNAAEFERSGYVGVVRLALAF